jgi:hypothetical protein
VRQVLKEERIIVASELGLLRQKLKGKKKHVLPKRIE